MSAIFPWGIHIWNFKTLARMILDERTDARTTFDVGGINDVMMFHDLLKCKLGLLKRNIKVHNKDLKYTAYTTLVRPQLEYASTLWSPHTAIDITKLEAVQRRSARWATRDYQRTSSVTQMINDLNWHTLEQRRVDSRLTLMYKITYDLEAIHAADYLIPNTRQSIHNHQLAYRQIPTLKDYYKYTFFPRTIVHWNALPLYIPILPTVAQFGHAMCQVVHVSP